MDNLVIDLKLTVSQVNMILAHLGRGAFADVASLIEEIRKQATPQVASAQQAASENESVQEPQSVQ